MNPYIKVRYKSTTVKKSHQLQLDANRMAKYQFLLQAGPKVSIPLEVQLERFKKGLKK